MRYRADHKAEVHQRIVKDASRRIRVEGMTGAAVSAVMRDSGLTHGGFYKHFDSKDDLLLESLRDGFDEIAGILAQAAAKSPPGEGWKAIVKTYLQPEMCEHPGGACPLPALAPEIARAAPAVRSHIVPEIVKYKDRMLPFMPGRRTADKEEAFFAIFSTMIGAIVLARILPMPAARAKVLASARDFLLESFGGS
jgi:TetR/AcrR family transcriptional repressor of nem operon